MENSWLYGGCSLYVANQKANDYHTILACISEEFKQVQGLNRPVDFISPLMELHTLSNSYLKLHLLSEIAKE